MSNIVLKRSFDKAQRSTSSEDRPYFLLGLRFMFAVEISLILEEIIFNF